MKATTIDLRNIPGFDPEFVPMPGGSYLPVNLRANIAYVAIQFPFDRHGRDFKGVLGKDLSTLDGHQAVKNAAMNVIAQMNRYVGFENVEGLNHFDLYYRATDDWDHAPAITDTASDLFIKSLGPKGLHSRTIFGVQSLPRNFCVGITASFTLL